MTRNPVQNDERIIAGLRNRDEAAFTILYDSYFAGIRDFVVRNNGSPDDAQDIFQETVLVLLRKVPSQDFELRSSLSTYIFSIASKLWLKRLRDSRKFLPAGEEMLENIPGEEEQFGAVNEKGIEERAAGFLARLSQKCRQLLRAVFFLNRKSSEIQEEFGYSSAHSAQNQKYKCIQQLKKIHRNEGNEHE